MEQFLESWNTKIPHFPLSHESMKDPAVIMGAMIEILKKIGINTEAVISGYGDAYKDEHTEYYSDLLPVVNVARVANVVSTEISGRPVGISQILTPNNTSLTSLAVLLNYSAFVDMQLNNWKPCHDEIAELQNKFEQVQRERNRLLKELNKATADKASRPQRVKKLDEEERTLKSQLKEELEQLGGLKESLKLLERELLERDVTLEQRRSQREALVVQLEKLNSQLVIDGDDLRFKEQQVRLKEKEAIEVLNGMTEAIKAKEDTINTFKTYKVRFDEAFALLEEIEEIVNGLNALENTDLNEADTEEAISKEQKAIAELEKAIGDLEAEERDYREGGIAEAEMAYEKANSELLKAQSYAKEVEDFVHESEAKVTEMQAMTKVYDEERSQLFNRCKAGEEYFRGALKGYQSEIVDMMKQAGLIAKDKLTKKSRFLNKE